MRVAEALRKRPLVSFIALSFLLTWMLLPFASVSIGISFLALFGPAAAAFVVAALQGPYPLRELIERLGCWRVPLRFYVLALLLPLPITLGASLIELAWGAAGPLRLQGIAILGLVVFVLVIGEEIGWRGLALPLLLGRHGPWAASAILGGLWALWHLPLFFLPGMPQYGDPFLPYVGYTIALSIILTFLFQRTRGSTLIATLFHGAANTFVVENVAAGAVLRGWGNALAYGLSAGMIGVFAWRTGRFVGTSPTPDPSSG